MELRALLSKDTDLFVAKLNPVTQENFYGWCFE